MAEQKEMINKYFCGSAIRASKVLFCIASPLLQKRLVEKGGENLFIPLFRPWAIIKYFLSFSLSLQSSKKALLGSLYKKLLQSIYNNKDLGKRSKEGC
jgi:hypothetical protein